MNDMLFKIDCKKYPRPIPKFKFFTFGNNNGDKNMKLSYFVGNNPG